jgi:ribosomal protein S6
MVLVDPTIAAREWTKVTEELDRIMKKHGATVIQFVKWGERKLAFPVRKAKRGTYALAYFAAPETVIGHIRRDMSLSELIYRHLITTTTGEMRKEAPKDFEIAGTIAAKRIESFGGGGFGAPGGFGGDRPDHRGDRR